MKVVIVGAGNVATVLGKIIKLNGHQIVQVISRNHLNAQILAKELNATFCDSSSAMDKAADLYLLAVSDNALLEIEESFHLNNKLVVHTAGAVSKEVLKNITNNYGVIYPLQSLRKENLNLQEAIPLLIDANNDWAMGALKSFALSISENVSIANDELRLKLHVAAVLVSNFTNHLYCLAQDYCTKEGADFKLLLPLIEETAIRLRKHSPSDMRTGPAFRKDTNTLQKHLQLLTKYPLIHHVYLKITDSIMESTSI